MAGAESTPYSAPDYESSLFAALEAQFRDPAVISAVEKRLLQDDPMLYLEISSAAASQAPGDPSLHAFYFTEFLLTAVSDREVTRATPTQLFWGSHHRA